MLVAVTLDYLFSPIDHLSLFSSFSSSTSSFTLFSFFYERVLPVILLDWMVGDGIKRERSGDGVSDWTMKCGWSLVVNLFHGIHSPSSTFSTPKRRGEVD